VISQELKNIPILNSRVDLILERSFVLQFTPSAKRLLIQTLA